MVLYYNMGREEKEEDGTKKSLSAGDQEFQLRVRESGRKEREADKKASGGLGGPIKGLQHFKAPRSRSGWSTHGTPLRNSIV